MDWIDDWMPTWQFAEVHHIESHASPAALLDAAAAYDPGEDPWIRGALALRESPGRLAAALGLSSAPADRPRFGKSDFLPLGRLGDEALAYGLVGRFWEPGYGLVPQADADAFRTFNTAGTAKLLLAIEARTDASAPTRASTRVTTRVTTFSRLVCTDADTHLRVAAYWALIRPVSSLIRQRLLGQIKQLAES